jgi:hypothetical protein
MVIQVPKHKGVTIIRTSGGVHDPVIDPLSIGSNPQLALARDRISPGHESPTVLGEEQSHKCSATKQLIR